MKIKKHVICPQRVRQVPPQFSWIDQRLVRERHYLQECSVQALALYLVLLTVSDAEGLSYYSAATLGRMLRLSAEQLSQARGQLERAQLIAYKHPLYQALSLDAPQTLELSGERSRQSLSAGEILRKIVGGES
ncbi:MAG: hypothetical protein ACKVG4_16190 [Longimicrobiales bacterium]|jgi:hypothetical protein